MSSYLRFSTPHVIKTTDNFLVPLATNFFEIERHLRLTQYRVETLETNYTALEARVAAIEAALSTST